jgi:predicted DNA-binding transcriptional regulator AlpA
MDLLSIDDIAAIFSVDRRTVAERWIHKPNFPAPVFAPSRMTRRWSREEVIAWATPASRRSARPTHGSTYHARG